MQSAPPAACTPYRAHSPFSMLDRKTEPVIGLSHKVKRRAGAGRRLIKQQHDALSAQRRAAPSEDSYGGPASAATRYWGESPSSEPRAGIVSLRKSANRAASYAAGVATASVVPTPRGAAPKSQPRHVMARCCRYEPGPTHQTPPSRSEERESPPQRASTQILPGS